MAATIAIARGYHRSGKATYVQRVGTSSAEAQAQTYHTQAVVEVRANGSGQFVLRRDGEMVFSFVWDDENTHIPEYLLIPRPEDT